MAESDKKKLPAYDEDLPVESNKDNLPAYGEDLHPDMVSTEPSILQSILSKAGGGIQSGIQTAEDWQRAVANAATLGLAGKAEAALGAGIDKLTGAPEPYSELFGKEQQASQAESQAAKQRSPVVSAIGGAEGIGAGALATPSIGLSEAAGPMAAAVKGGILPTATKIGAMAGEGAIIGGIGGLGQTTGNVLTPEGRAQAGQDVLSGAKVGGLVGGGLGALGAGITKTAQIAEPFVQDHPYLRQLVLSAKLGKPALGDEARQSLITNEGKTAQDLAKNVSNADNILGQGIEKVVTDADRNGFKIDMDSYTVDALKSFLNDNRTVLSPKAGNSC